MTRIAVGLSAVHRRNEIVRLANTAGLANVDELSARFGVTPSTIRRDLAVLTAAGTLARTYGGAISTSPHSEASLKQRFGEAFEAKRAIAKEVAARVVDGETIFLDAGSTVAALAHELRTRKDLTVLTSSIPVISALADASGVRLECLGGTLRSVTQGFVGPLAEAAVERFTFDRAFFGTDGVTAEYGICEADLAQSRLKELVMRRAADICVLAHAAKLGRKPFRTWAKPPDAWTLITDSGATRSQLHPFKRSPAAISVIVADGWPAKH